MVALNDTELIKSEFPTMIALPDEVELKDFSSWYNENRDLLEGLLLKRGAVLLRGVKVNSSDDFNNLLPAFGETFMNYRDGFSPRTKLSDRVYTSTEYDADFFISLHNELSYSSRWPSKILFYCLIAAEKGGETPIADCRRVLQNLNWDLVDEFTRKGVRYIRNLHGGDGLGPSWQQTFETNSKSEVELFCTTNNIQFQWTSHSGLRLIQIKPAIIYHHKTKEKLWFNQIDQFHPSHLEESVYDALTMMYGEDEEQLPMYGSFGDGTRIPESAIHEITRTINDTAVAYTWKKGDLLILDNEISSHGRTPYKGNRKILVSMLP